jgi:hypothetical protein
LNVTLRGNGNGGQTPPTAELSCGMCASMPVCRVIAAFAPLMDPKEYGVGEPPIVPESLAVICEAFNPKEPIVVNYEPEYPHVTTRLPDVEHRDPEQEAYERGEM